LEQIYSSYCPESLRILAFEDIDDDTVPDKDGLPSPSVKRDRTEAVADMLLVNKRVDEIQIPVHDLPVHDYTTFNQALWNTLVVSRVERRKKQFIALQRIEVPSITRAAVIARALACVAGKPSIV
jgi:hypothetical protein